MMLGKRRLSDHFLEDLEVVKAKNDRTEESQLEKKLNGDLRESEWEHLGHADQRLCNLEAPSHESISVPTPVQRITNKLKYEDYKYGWICPLEVDLEAALYMLDEKHEALTRKQYDKNIYTLGSINGNHVVIAGQARSGNCSAAVVATDLRRTFPGIKYVLLVGIGGGVPTAAIEKRQFPCYGRIRLGDVVVSQPNGVNSGVIQYDHGKIMTGGRFERKGVLDSPPDFLLSAVQKLSITRREDWVNEKEDPILRNLRRIDTTKLPEFEFPGLEYDLLFAPEYHHRSQGEMCIYNDDATPNCDRTQLQPLPIDFGRRRRALRNAAATYTIDPTADVQVQIPDPEYIAIHRGTIASGEKVIKDAKLRDQLAKEHNILCFETEAAGVLRGMPCLVIRGIAHYCDSHQNDIWHGYAAATAASYARLLISEIPVEEVN